MDSASVGMIRIILLLRAFSILADFIAASHISAPTDLRGFLRKTEKMYNGYGPNAIRADLKFLWAEVLKGGHKHPNEMNDLQKFLKKTVEDFHRGFERKIYENLNAVWENYKTVFGKEYTPREEKMRKAIFEKYERRMERHNELFEQDKVTYSMRLNHLSDRTAEELEKMNGFRWPNETNHGQRIRIRREADPFTYKYDEKTEVPYFVNWVKRGYVTSVKVQGECGSCYAFAGIGALEAYHKKKTGKLIELSVQNILDCTWTLGNRGCEGGIVYVIFQYAHLKGVMSEEQYPYTMNSSHNCKWKKEKVVATNEYYLDVRAGDELSLLYAVANYGPIAVGIGITEDFVNYGSGVFSPKTCGPISHSVLIVGYGTCPVQGDYWVVKNSYGEWWGEDGYIKIARNKNNMCDVASRALFPI